jgi:hypothetical protein
MSEDDETLPADLHAALHALPKEVPMAAALEDRTVAALRRSGALFESAEHAGPRRGRRGGAATAWLLRLAAALALLAIGYGVAEFRGRPAAEQGARYALLLREDSSFEVPPQGEAALVAEYGQWARELRRGQKLVLGEELDAGVSLILPPGQTSAAREAAPVSGLFIIVAATDAEAAAIARSCPHLRHGGSIELRRIPPS